MNPFLKYVADNDRICLTEDIVNFHQKFDLTYDGGPRELPAQLEKFRRRFIKEEANEFEEADNDNDRLDAIVDLMYVCLGYCYLRGWDVGEAWKRVHAANMTKERAYPGDPRARSDWDVVKPKDFVKPDHTDLVVPAPADYEDTADRP